MRRRFPLWLLPALCGALLLAACTSQETPPPAPSHDHPTPPENGFLTLRPPTKPDPRTPELPQPLTPPLLILHSGQPLPEPWLKEWKGDRNLSIQQRPVTAADATLPTEASLLILPPDRLGPLVAQRPLLPLVRPSHPVQASPLFLHHPYDPDQRATLPFRWSPYVLYRRRATTDAAFPPYSITWQPDEGILWPEPPAPIQAFWRKSQAGVANTRTSAAKTAAWKKIESDLLPVLLSPATVWTRFLEGDSNRCWLPAFYRCQLPAEKRQDGTLDWVIPAFGTLIHLDLLAIPADAPQAAAAVELAAFLITPEIQQRLAPQTGWLPINQPLGKETQPSPCPLPNGDWLDKCEITYPEHPFPIAPETSPKTNPDPPESEPQVLESDIHTSPSTLPAAEATNP